MREKGFIDKFLCFVGFAGNTTDHKEKIISGLGGFCGIFGIWVVSDYFLEGMDVPLIVASMGASSVLLYAVPHGQLSQPWNLCVSHLVAALSGVTCAMFIPDQGLAAGCAVGLAITLMHYTQSIHPPGGATALMAVIGGPSIHQLGYNYVITPVMLNTMIILAIAILFNYPFKWRRYPESIIPEDSKCAQDQFRHEDLQYALEQAHMVSTVTEHDLAELFRLAEKHASDDHLPVEAILNDRYYSNGKLGSAWSVRHIMDGPDDSLEPDDQLVYKVVAGDNLYKVDSITRENMAKWSRYELAQDPDRHHGWRRINDE